MAKKILVTGADGFIGSHLVDALVRKGDKVRAFCLYNSFNSIGWLRDLEPEILENVDIILGDIRDFDSISKAAKDVQVIFHLAALIAIPYSYIAPESYVDTNIKGTLNVLRAALNKNMEQVIHTSTSEVYGTAQFVPITEQHPLVGQSPYSASKIGADQIAYSFYCSYGLPVSTVRPFNTYGPRQSARAVISTVINQILLKNSTLKLGNIHATRDFNFVHDTVSGMISFLNNPKTFGEVINLGSGIEISINELVNIISRIADHSVEIQVETQRIRPERSEVERLCASNLKAKDILSWSPKYSLEEGLKITYEWFKTYAEKNRMLESQYVI